MWRGIPDRECVTKFMRFTATGQIPQNYNAITLINMGTATVTIGNIMTLIPGASLGWSHNAMEIEKAQIDVDFAAGGTNNLIAIIIYYSDVEH